MIRSMNNLDMNRVEELWFNESIRVHNWMDDPQGFWDEKRKDFHTALHKSDTKLVFDEDNIVKGFVIKWPDNYIPEIFVDHKHRACPNGKSKKIGRALLKPLKESCPSLTASVYMLNHYAIKFYIKNDFIIKSFYAEQGTGFAKLSIEWKKH